MVLFTEPQHLAIATSLTLKSNGDRTRRRDRVRLATVARLLDLVFICLSRTNVI